MNEQKINGDPVLTADQLRMLTLLETFKAKVIQGQFTNLSVAAVLTNGSPMSGHEGPLAVPNLMLMRESLEMMRETLKEVINTQRQFGRASPILGAPPMFVPPNLGR